ncbi:polysaccharide pyruvyl transferase family protein [Bifidobacterium pseudolongum]|uniref:polysaccharide pyruvyl transferase family protein n=1 Tax=Bifidobacterium pseudolongum TaxID=1694 RepID=UPI00101F427D|nr:polysaccharide pyruvyl transferase family protein [Bifidobacterium pseudolongum]RYQ06224.1 polysaccharide pyruvyl transferase [Bifidobacterium pseudolongum subsp. globosum]
MTKIGILTFVNTLNYGAALQCHALYEYLNEMGFDVEVIDYNNKEIEGTYRMPSTKDIHSVKEFVTFPFKYMLQKKWKRNFYQYDTTMKSFAVKSISDINSRYDAVVVGSDQVWNLRLTGDDWSYYLPEVKKAKKIAYAASFGNTNFSKVQIDKIKKLLSTFNALSVREKQGVEFCESLGYNATQVLDPTLLQNTRFWRQQERAIAHPERYVLVYAVGLGDKVLQEARKIASSIDAKIVYINSPYEGAMPIKGVKNVYALDPRQFVYLFMRASFVVTSSFHGVCFSLIGKKNFKAIIHNGVDNTNSRIVSLVENLGISHVLDSEADEKIDYANVDSTLKEMRFLSQKFIEDNIKF